MTFGVDPDWLMWRKERAHGVMNFFLFLSFSTNLLSACGYWLRSKRSHQSETAPPDVYLHPHKKHFELPKTLCLGISYIPYPSFSLCHSFDPFGYGSVGPRVFFFSFPCVPRYHNAHAAGGSLNSRLFHGCRHFDEDHTVVSRSLGSWLLWRVLEQNDTSEMKTFLQGIDKLHRSIPVFFVALHGYSNQICLLSVLQICSKRAAEGANQGPSACLWADCLVWCLASCSGSDLMRRVYKCMEPLCCIVKLWIKNIFFKGNLFWL